MGFDWLLPILLPEAFRLILCPLGEWKGASLPVPIFGNNNIGMNKEFQGFRVYNSNDNDEPKKRDMHDKTDDKDGGIRGKQLVVISILICHVDWVGLFWQFHSS